MKKREVSYCEYTGRAYISGYTRIRPRLCLGISVSQRLQNTRRNKRFFKRSRREAWTASRPNVLWSTFRDFNTSTPGAFRLTQQRERLRPDGEWNDWGL